MIRIAQLLCPQRHCILALAFDDRAYSDKWAANELVARFFANVEQRILNRQCGLCGSTQLRAEVGVTRFANMAKAAPFLAQCQVDQLRTGLRLRAENN
jgi:hypothetical protein